MNISLPDALRAIADERAAQAGFKSTSEYVAELIRRDQEQDPTPGSSLAQPVEGEELPPIKVAAIIEEGLAVRGQLLKAANIQAE